MSDLETFKATYFDECSELLVELEEQFAAIEEGERDADRLNAVFRAIHSIKGGAGAFGFSDLVGFAHHYETLLDYVRTSQIDLNDEVVILCIRANDIVADFVNAARTGAALSDDYGHAEKERFEALCSSADGAADDDGEPIEEFDIDFEPVSVDLDARQAVDRASEATGAGWRVVFTPHRELYARANDPLLLFRELAELGPARVQAVLREIPPLADFDPFSVYCHWEIAISNPDLSEEAIREVFEFVEGDCDIEIDRIAESVEHELPAGDEEIFPSFADLADEIAAESRPVLVSVPETGASFTASSGLTGSTPESAAAPAQVGVQSIRVDLEKVDRVVNMVGELVITQSMLTQQMDETLRARYTELVRGLEVLAQTTRGLQDSVMAIRAQPVKSVFSRMPRLVRELAIQTSKKIRLDTVGENTEIDKTVIEQLSDPLTHMIRNSADHGIETPEKRIAAGKPETGTIRLSAEQAGGNILIIIEDDGAGINRDRVAQIARDRGIVGADQQLTEEQIDNLIFAPGFSTVETVSDISGRGVGMDVVLSNIKKIGGSVQVRSTPGHGTRMTLRLPLTLAVLDVMLVTIAGSPYVIPLSSIVETIQASKADFGHMPTGGKVLNVRGEYVQVIDLAEKFGTPTDAVEKDRFVVLCEAEGTAKVALVVDDIIGQQQVVIKSLEENFESIDGIAGGTILGDGNVALIVDVQGLRLPDNRRSAA